MVAELVPYTPHLLRKGVIGAKRELNFFPMLMQGKGPGKAVNSLGHCTSTVNILIYTSGPVINCMLIKED